MYFTVQNITPSNKRLLEYCKPGQTNFLNLTPMEIGYENFMQDEKNICKKWPKISSFEILNLHRNSIS